jgi:hypothetical protein
MCETKFVGKIKTHISCSVTFFFCRKCAVCEAVWENVETGRPRMTIWRIACWIPKATNTHSEYVILIAFPLQQRASLSRYTCFACLVIVLWSFRRMQAWWHLHYKDTRLILYREVIGVYLENYTEHINGKM